MLRTAGQRTIRPILQSTRGSVRRCHQGKPASNGKQPPSNGNQGGNQGSNGGGYQGNGGGGGHGRRGWEDHWGDRPMGPWWYRRYNKPWYYYVPPKFYGPPGFLKIAAGVATGVVVGNAISGKCSNKSKWSSSNGAKPEFDCDKEWGKMLTMANDFDEFMKNKKKNKRDKTDPEELDSGDEEGDKK